jgi:hypothetical protein
MGGYEGISYDGMQLLLPIECFMMEMLKLCNEYQF